LSTHREQLLGQSTVVNPRKTHQAEAQFESPALEATRGDLIAIIAALILPSANTWLYFFQAESLPAGVQLAIFNTVKIVQFGFPLVWVLAVQRTGVTVWPRHKRGIGIGLMFGAVVAIAMFVLYLAGLRDSSLLGAAKDQIVAKVTGWGINRPWKYAALGLFYSVVHSLLEEYYWRWFVFGQLRRLVSLRTAVAVSSLGFMAHHVLVLGKFFGFDAPATWALSACVAVGGAVWAWLYERSGSLFGPWASHCLIDAAIFLIGFDIVRDLLVN
jgi:membrane protease YdiL (CAAX protease family)